MNMTQVVLGAALGFLVAQGTLMGIRQLLGWAQRDNVRLRLRALAPAPAVISGFIRYAGPVGASAALVTLGVWAVGDYLAAKSARAAALASLYEAPAVDAPTDPHNSGEERAGAAAVAESAAAPANDAVDPYQDPDFKVRKRAHRGGTDQALKEALLQRSEMKARNELLREMHQHAQRSQYDCEAAEHAEHYLKAGLDVWGFSAWQAKYFPTAGYQGATAPACKDIKSVLDSSALDLHATVAQK